MQRQREKREEEGSGEGGGRKNSTLTEKLRRGEHQELFTRLKQVLFMEKLDPKVSKLHLLSQALKEIRTLSVDSESLEEKKRMLTEIQSVYVKEITYISGKPEELIKAKLKEIWEKKRALAAQRRADMPSTSVHVSSTCQLSSTAFTLSPNTLTVSQLSRASSLGQAGAARGSVKPVAAVLRTESGKIILPASIPAGGAVCPVKVMKRPSTVTSLSTTTTSAAKEAVEKECTPRIIHPSQPLSQTPSPQCSASVSRPGGILVTDTGDGENQLTPRESTRQGRTPKVRRVGVTTSPVVMTGPGGNSAKVTPAGGNPVKRPASSPATRGRPPKVRKAGDSPSPAPGTRAGLSPVVKTDGSAAKPTRGDSPARTTRAGVNSSAAMTKGSPGKTPQAMGRPGTQPVTRSVGGKRTMRSDKA